MVAGQYFLFGLLALGQSALGLPSSSGSGASGILSSIDTINSGVSTINSTLGTFSENSDVTSTALKIQSEATDLLNDINKGAQVAEKADTLDSDDQQKLYSATVSLSDNVFSLLDGLVDKQDVFKKAVLGGSADGLVDKDLENLKKATDSFGQAIIKTLSGSVKDKGPALLKKIDSHFDTAIKAFSS
ncbi:uncharacterized protein N7484_011715 [Penicillium longicatenatum]|uniref:uncharacterized protein n=1 Tax=Penicillium longicatenatum TaxID=1561947 RepID=UPI002548EC85|nr:uncharacterized protein N7484_011715 [Penicillium longicatenatum]KAJ5631615.1 hypothetical protein N7484_011715 [Penicillium longicatenatum]